MKCILSRWSRCYGVVMGIVLLMVWGCATAPKKPEGPIQQATASQLVGLLRDREGSITTLKGLFRAQIQGPGIPGTQNINGVLFYQRPQMVRMKGFTRFGGMVFDFSMDHGMYFLSLPSEKKMLTGRVGELVNVDKLGRPVRLSLLALEALLGQLLGVEEPTMDASADGEHYQLHVAPSPMALGLFGPQLVRRLTVERRFFRVVQVDYFTNSGEPTLTVTCDDFRQIGEEGGRGTAKLELPYSITAEDQQEEGQVEMSFEEIVTNAELKV